MSDRKPKVGEVWTSVPGATWECLKHIQDDRYVWWVTEGDTTYPELATASFLTPPTTPPPAWLEKECWVLIPDADVPRIAQFLFAEDEIGDEDYDGAVGNEARVKVDPSTFEWLDGR